MTDDNIRQKALALLNEVQAEHGGVPYTKFDRRFSTHEAICRAIEQHEAFKQEVSDVVYKSLMSIAKGCAADAAGDLSRFIIPKPKPDPLVEVMREATAKSSICENDFAANIRAALDARGLEIREKNDD